MPIIHPYKHINDYGKRSVQAVQNVAPDVVKMSAVRTSRRKMLVQNAVKEMHEFEEGRRKRTPHLTRLENFDKRVADLFSQANNYHAILKDLFGDGHEDEHEDRRAAFNRIPIELFKALDDCEGDERIRMMNTMIDEEMERKGNRCNHSLKDLYNNGIVHQHDYNPEGKRLLPRIIWDALDRLSYAILFPSKYKKLFFHKTDEKVARWGKKMRQIRTDGRVGMLRVLTVLLEHTDLKSLRSGHFNKDDGSLSGIRVGTIAKRSNMAVSRVKTALRNLEETQIIHDTDGGKKQQREEDEDGNWKGFAIVRVFKTHLFEQLGMSDTLARHRNPEEYQKQIDKNERQKKLDAERRAAEAKDKQAIQRNRKAAEKRAQGQNDAPASSFPTNFWDGMVNNGADPEFS